LAAEAAQMKDLHHRPTSNSGIHDEGIPAPAIPSGSNGSRLSSPEIRNQGRMQVEKIPFGVGRAQGKFAE